MDQWQAKHPIQCLKILHPPFIWFLIDPPPIQSGILSVSAADRNFEKLDQNIGRKSQVFVAFWTGIRKSFLLDRKQKMPIKIFSGFERIDF